MLQGLQLSSLLGSSGLSQSVSEASGEVSVASIFNNKATLATITTDLLNAHFDITPKTDTVDLSSELKSFITNFLDEDKASSLLNSLTAIEKLNGADFESNSTAEQLLSAGETGTTLDLLA